MNVFIGWSGRRSRLIAEELAIWFPQAVQNATVFVPSPDIPEGKGWFAEIGAQLGRADVGILCLTPENVGAPWLLFEAGALARQFGDALAWGVLFDELQPADVEGPLSNLQLTRFGSEDLLRLLQTLNRKLEGQALADEVVERIAEQQFPQLERSVAGILDHDEPTGPRRSERSMLTEVVELTRALAREVLPADSFRADMFELSGKEISFGGEAELHPVRVRVFPVQHASGPARQAVTVTRRGVETTPFEGPYPWKGVTIEVLFWNKVDEFFTFKFTFHKGSTQVRAAKAEVGEDEKALLSDAIWRD